MTTDKHTAEVERFAVCVTCGQLKHVDTFQDGDCTCDDCYEAGLSELNYRPTEDGYFEKVQD